jgi:hypothetical protein
MVTAERDIDATVRDDPQNHRYLLEVDGEVVGIAV